MDFGQVERQAARLRQDLAAGRLTEEQFRSKLREMMVQDEEGSWWMVGCETSDWYHHDGADWVRADPPWRRAAAPTQPASAASRAPVAPASPQPAAQGIGRLIAGSAISSLIGLLFLPMVGAIVGLLLAYAARSRVRASGSASSRNWLVTACIAWGWIAIAWGVILLLAWGATMVDVFSF